MCEISLKDIASRLAALDAASPAIAGLITFPIGAVFHAFEAQECGFVDRDDSGVRWKDELNGAREIARSISNSDESPKSQWTGIVHFNSALMRIDVGYERLLRHITGNKNGNVKVLAEDAVKHGVSEEMLRGWKSIRKEEVNAMKHRNPEVLQKERIGFADMLRVLCDLVDLLESRLR